MFFIVHLDANLDATRFCAERLQSLIRTLELSRLDEYASLQKVASFATLVATYEKGTVHKHFQLSNSNIFIQAFCSFWSPSRLITPQFQIRCFISRWFIFFVSHLPPLSICRCLDPSLAIKPVFERFSSVVITSGTISPLDMYPKMLQFTPVVQETYAMTLTRNAFLPLVSSKLTSISSKLTFI